MVSHLLSHHGIKHECLKCQKLHKSSKSLEKHMKSVHSSKQSKCSICQKNFLSNHYLKIHIKTVHEKIKPHLCSNCGKGFGTEAYLKKHVSERCGKNGLQEIKTCPICKEKFQTIADKMEHIISKHNDQKLHRCSKCPAVYVR